ncbi:MAG: RtcB family protein, partial [Deltaproteobacteria bacterium]|nr:RtcB family protein [Deltaproteobacteria bacterium]
IGVSPDYVKRAMGTLGGGNHFIEMGIDTLGNLWIFVHSGSRFLGKKVAEYWQKRAKRRRPVASSTDLSELKKNFTGKELEIRIKEMRSKANPKKISLGLEYLEDGEADGYLADMVMAQVYARENVGFILKAILRFFGDAVPVDQVISVHNYIDFEDNIIRKGAVRSYLGEKLFVPLNMRDGVLLCEGKSNPSHNFSVGHGAGRVSSRREAKQRFSLESFKEAMNGIYSTCVNSGTLDESPMAYKDAHEIMRIITATVTVLDWIKPIYNFKASVDE